MSDQQESTSENFQTLQAGCGNNCTACPPHDGPVLFAYHGTPHPEKVEAEGLRAELHDGPSPCVWMARDPSEAESYGTVFRIDLSYLDGDWPLNECGHDAWQAHYGGDVPAEALSRV